MGISTRHMKYQLLGNRFGVRSVGTSASHVPGDAPLLTEPAVLQDALCIPCLSSLRYELPRALQLETVSQDGPKDEITQ